MFISGKGMEKYSQRRTYIGVEELKNRYVKKVCEDRGILIDVFKKTKEYNVIFNIFLEHKDMLKSKNRKQTNSFLKELPFLVEQTLLKEKNQSFLQKLKKIFCKII